MQIDKRFFHSRVARRIFLLFILSTLIPVTCLAIFQALQLNQQLHDNGSLQVKQAVKNIGMELIGKLATLDDQLHLLEHALRNVPLSQIDKEKTFTMQLPEFTAISVWPPNGKIIALKGALDPRKLTLPALTSNKTWLTPRKGNVYLINRLKNEAFLIGEVPPNKIWHFETHTSGLLWIIDGENHLIYANTHLAPPQQQTPTAGSFIWQNKNTAYFASQWDIFLRYRFQNPDWTVILAEPKARLFTQVKRLIHIFLPTALIALLLTMLLSQFQIRRYLVPLEQLAAATRRISLRNFKAAPVTASADEFEELGHAFNTMGVRLNHQFQVLTLISTLDQALLHNPDVKNMIKILLRNLPELVHYDLLVIGIVTAKNSETLQLTIDYGDGKTKKTKYISLSDEEKASLLHNQILRLSLPEDTLPSYIGSLKPRQNHFILFPLLHQQRLRAFVCLGFNDITLFNQCDTHALKDVFHRFSVAFTHSEWEERLYHQAHYDDLTELPNRLVLREKLTKAIERSNKKQTFLILMFIDLDNFKNVNDTLGHVLGDTLLTQVAKAMKRSLANTGTLSRFGGDEFIVLVTDIQDKKTARDIATRIAERLLATLAKPFNLAGNEFNASASIGIVIHGEGSVTSNDLLKYADMSMYKAKQEGKNRYEFFSDALEEMVQERNQLLQDLHNAIKENQFLLYLQPKFNTVTHEVVGAELLLRWQHPTRGLLTPDAFLTLAEESNLIIPIGKLALTEACHYLQHLSKHGLAVRLALNIAAEQFSQPDLHEVIITTTQAMGIGPEQLEFEITESTFINNFAQAITVITTLRQLGFRFALDDFGTGYSSLSYLKKLPIHLMKIDQAFVKGLPTDQKNLSIVRTIITLAQNLNLSLVAEGVETLEQAELLGRLGCPIQQGYFFSKPLPLDEFIQFVTHKKIRPH